MGKYVDCPFCGQRGRKSKEHVWAQWLHRTRAAKILTQDSTGQLMDKVHYKFDVDDQGRFVQTPVVAGQWATLLPHVQVLVCEECNNGWMSRLEDEVRHLVGPFIFGEQGVVLDAEQLTTIATWATKSWMAYALNRSPLENPFTTAEYRAMAAEPKPLDRSRIWLMACHHDGAQVGMGVDPTLMSAQVPDLATEQNNAALCYLAASCVVLFMVLAPPDSPEGFLDVMAMSAGPALQSGKARRIHPSPRRQGFPLEGLSQQEFYALRHAPHVMHELDMPGMGLTPQQLAQVREEWQEGADPAELRAKWAPEK